MSFFEDLKKNATGAADKAVKKTTEITGLAKLKMAIRSKESKLSSVYEEIGRLFYTAERDGEDCTGEIAAFIMKADKLKAEIEEAKKETAKLKNVKTCDGCGAEIDRNLPFCPWCGKKQEMPVDEEPAEDEDDIVDEFADEAEETADDIAEKIEEAVDNLTEEIKDSCDCDKE